MKLRHLLVILVLIAGIGFAAYYIGKQKGTTQITQIATNEVLIKQIAELSSLEVQGNASITESNVSNDGSWSGALRKLFVENTIQISIPYIAKYGVRTDSNDLRIVQEEDIIHIYLPEPQLLSFEMRLDKASNSSKLGWMQSESNAAYNQVQKKLYEQTRRQMEQSSKNTEQAKAKIIAILKQYYQPMQKKVEVTFGKESGLQLFPSLN
jgi:hypothetical protein